MIEFPSSCALNVGEWMNDCVKELLWDFVFEEEESFAAKINFMLIDQIQRILWVKQTIELEIR